MRPQHIGGADPITHAARYNCTEAFPKATPFILPVAFLTGLDVLYGRDLGEKKKKIKNSLKETAAVA